MGSAFIILVLACLISAKVDNIIHEVRFAEVYRCFLFPGMLGSEFLAE